LHIHFLIFNPILPTQRKPEKKIWRILQILTKPNTMSSPTQLPVQIGPWQWVCFVDHRGLRCWTIFAPTPRRIGSCSTMMAFTSSGTTTIALHTSSVSNQEALQLGCC
jgi:hypothetical protein